MTTNNTSDDNDEGYQSNTIDPGWPLTVVVILVCCVFDFVLLPLSVRWKRQQMRKESRHPSSTVGAEQQHHEQDHGYNNNDNVVSKGSSSNRSFASSMKISVLDSIGKVRQPDRCPTEIFLSSHDKHSVNTENDDSSPTAMNRGQSHPSVANPSSLSNSQHPPSQEDEESPRNTEIVLEVQDQPLSPRILEYSIVDIVRWESELKQLAWLSVPYSIQGCIEGVFQLVNVSLLGHLLGTQEASTYVIVTCLIEFTATFSYGFREAIVTLGPQADGAGNDLLMGRYLQLGIIFFVLANIPGVVIWSLWAYDAILWFGYDDNTAALGQSYSYPFLVMVILRGIDECLRLFFNIIDHEKYSTVVGIVGASLDTSVIVIMAGLGYDNLVSIGIVQATLAFGILIADLGIVLHRGWMDDYLEGFARTFSFKDTKAVKAMSATGTSLGISWILVYGEWEIMTVFAGFMGAQEVTTWAIIGLVWNTMERITKGLSGAAEKQVGFRMASGEPHIAKLVAYKAIYLGAVVSTIIASLIFCVSMKLPGWLTPDPALQSMILELLPLVGFGQLMLGVGHICWFVLAAQGRTRLATIIEIISSWCIVLPAGVVGTFILNFNLLGLVAAIVLGYCLGGASWPYFIMTSDWTALSREVRLLHATDGAQYEEYDWGDLPPQIQEAAHVLGYNPDLWQSGRDPNLRNEAWDTLSPAMQEAAGVLGYNRKRWDKKGDQSSTSSRETTETLGYFHLDWSRLPQ